MAEIPFQCTASAMLSPLTKALPKEAMEMAREDRAPRSRGSDTSTTNTGPTRKRAPQEKPAWQCRHVANM